MDHFEQPIKPYNILNPILWDNNVIKKPVQISLLKIARAFWKFLDVDTKIHDIVISGSQANYNYSIHSDIDLHIIVDYDTVQCDLDVNNLFDTKRKLWKEQHNIDIHGIPVEVYVEDINNPAVSSSYSLIKNQWINPPKHINIDIDTDHIERICLSWIKVITAAIKSQDLDQCERVKDLLWSYRKTGLSKQGEMGTSNLVFKTLRNNDVTDRLLKTVNYLKDQELSLENR